MQAVIMAAGRGVRMGRLTKNLPKALLPICGRPIIEYTIEALPSCISEVIIAVKHLGQAIKERLGDNYCGLPISYVEQKQMPGTAGALWETKPLLKTGNFLVLNGDDLYNQQDVQRCLNFDLALGLSKSQPPSRSYLGISLDSENFIAGWHLANKQEMELGILLVNGIYLLDQRIFQYQPAPIANGEYGLPQTVLAMARDHKIAGVIMNFWRSINSPEDILTAERYLTKGR